MSRDIVQNARFGVARPIVDQVVFRIANKPVSHGKGPKPGNGNAPRPYLLDTIAIAPIFAGSLSKLRAAYNNGAVEIRNGGSNALATIGFNGRDFDIAAAIAHANNGDGNAYVRTVFDQSVAAGSPMQQTTNAAQPPLVLSGVCQLLGGSVVRPAWKHAGHYLTLAGAQAQPMITSTVLRWISTIINAQVYSDNANSSLFLSGVPAQISQYAGASASFSGNIADNDVAIITELKNGASSKGRYNGVETATNPGTNGINGHSLGATTGGANPAGMYCAEHLIFAVSGTSAQMLAMEQNQRAYYGTPP